MADRRNSFTNDALWRHANNIDHRKAVELLRDDFRFVRVENDGEPTTAARNNTRWTFDCDVSIGGTLTSTGTGTTKATHLVNTALGATGIRVDNAPSPAVGSVLTYTSANQATWQPSASPSNPNVGFARTSGSDANPGTQGSPCLTLQQLYNLGYRIFDLGDGFFGTLNLASGGGFTSLRFRGVSYLNTGGQPVSQVSTIVADGSIQIDGTGTVQFGDIYANGVAGSVGVDGTSGWSVYLENLQCSNVYANGGPGYSASGDAPGSNIPATNGGSGGAITLVNVQQPIPSSFEAQGGPGGTGNQGLLGGFFPTVGGNGGNGGTITLERNCRNYIGFCNSSGGGGGTGGTGADGDGMTVSGDGATGGNAGSGGTIYANDSRLWNVDNNSGAIGAGGSPGADGGAGTGATGSTGAPATSGAIYLEAVSVDGYVHNLGTDGGIGAGQSIKNCVIAGDVDNFGGGGWNGRTFLNSSLGNVTQAWLVGNDGSWGGTVILASGTPGVPGLYNFASANLG